MDQSFDLVAGTRKRRRKAVPVWALYILAAVLSGLAAWLWTTQAPPDVFLAMVRTGGPTWAAPYVLVEGVVIGIVAWAVIFFGLLRDDGGAMAGLILFLAAALPALAISDVARFHYLDVLRYQQAARSAAVRYHTVRDRLTDELNADMDQLALFDISYRAWTVHPADFPRFEANLVKARAVLADYRGRTGDARRLLKTDIRSLKIPRDEQDRLVTVAEQERAGADADAFWTIQNQELDETAALLKDLERANGGKLDEADFTRHQATLFALIKASNERYRKVYDAEDARELALVAAIR